MSTRRMKCIRVLNIWEADELYVACDPDMPVEEVITGLESLDPQFVLDAANMDGRFNPPLVFTPCEDQYQMPGFFRWVPSNDGEFSCYLRRASGPGRGSFFVRFFDIGEVRENV